MLHASFFCVKYAPSFNMFILVLLFSSLRLLQQISVFQLQIKQGIALPDTLSIIG